jgi:uncharacterized protein (DUF433 family)
MKNEKLLKRIILDPKVIAGKPVIRGTRLTVDFILNFFFAHGATENEILEEYKGLNVEDIQAYSFLPPNSLRVPILCHWWKV